MITYFCQRVFDNYLRNGAKKQLILERKKTLSLYCQLKLSIKMYHILCTTFNLRPTRNERFVFQMKYGKHPVSTSVIYQLYRYFRHFAEHLTCNSNFRGCNRPRKLKTVNIYPHIFEAKTRKFGDAKIFHFTVSIYL